MTDRTVEIPRIEGLPADLTNRPADYDDIDALIDLFNLCDRRWNDGINLHTAEDIRSEWDHPQFDRAKQTRVIERNNRIVGYVEVWYQEPWIDAGIWFKLHPELEGQSIEARMLAWGESLFLPEDHMPEPILPEGYVFRTMRMDDNDQDLRSVFTAIRDAFRDHYGYVERDFEVSFQNWSHFVTNDEHFDPALTWVVEAPDGEIAGVSVNWDRHGADESVGWVGTLGVVREHRRKGLALALLHQGFRQFVAMGKARAGLGVDADSLTGATRLYERAGMYVAKEDYNYEKVLREGRDLRRK